jgi:hypothetical protein
VNSRDLLTCHSVPISHSRTTLNGTLVRCFFPPLYSWYRTWGVKTGQPRLIPVPFVHALDIAALNILLLNGRSGAAQLRAMAPVPLRLEPDWLRIQHEMDADSLVEDVAVTFSNGSSREAGA